MPERRRRKSLSIFRPSLTNLTPIHDSIPDSAPVGTVGKQRRTASFFSPSRSSSPSSSGSPILERTNSQNSNGVPSSPKSRPRTLQRPARPTSIFGSLRSLHPLQDGDDDLVRTNSKHSSLNEEPSTLLDVANMFVLHHGEVQMTGGVFRKKTQYLVLTNTHLLRFKSQERASEVFPSIPSSLGRSTTLHHSRMSSFGSVHEIQISVDAHLAIPLEQVVAVYKLDDGRPYFSIEIAHLDEMSNNASTMTLQLSDPRESDLWLTTMRATITKSHLIEPLPFEQKAIEYVARALEQDFDYDPRQFRMFKVVKRSTKSGGRSSSDDLAKLTSSICYLAIGIHKVHLIPLPRSSKSASSTSLSDLSGESYGVMTLTSICLQTFDDAFQLGFRLPLRQTSSLYLASSCAADIALCIRQAAEFARPEWLEQPFKWNVPSTLDEAILPILSYEGDEHLFFDRTLTAYCVGYKIDASNIRYTVNYSCDDAPEFALLPPANSRRSKYTLLELLAVMRALRYNESFHAITFRNVSLDILSGVHDPYGSDHMLSTTRSGDSINIRAPEDPSLIVQEIQSLALKSKRLRRLDFSNCLQRRLSDVDEGRDRGCGICEALFPLCGQQLTNVDWITLTGIILGEIDMDYIYAAAIEKSCHFRALELGSCGLTDGKFKVAMQGICYQEDTLESIDISNNPVRLSPESFNRQLGRFSLIRKLNLSNVQVTTSPEPLIAADVISKWKLEELTLGGIKLNQHTLNVIATYLTSPRSETLHVLRLNQCQLTGKDVANLLQAMTNDSGNARNLHLYVSENQLGQQHQMLVDCFERSMTPSRITMQMLDYSNERDFQALIKALVTNTSLKYLDISRTSLPFEASQESCEILRSMFEMNDTLEELNLSGEQSHLEAVTLGHGLSESLKGLEQNESLKVIRIENQILALPGASSLASVLQKNTTLREIYCDGNEINLQAFTTLVNAAKTNTTVLHIPNMDKDRAWSRKKIDQEIDNLRGITSSSSPTTAKGTVKRTISAAMAGGRSFSARSIEKPNATPTYTEQDMQAAVGGLNQRWDTEIARLQSYLARNYCIANSLPISEDTLSSSFGSTEKPPAVGSLATALRDARSNQTPTAEMDLQLGGNSGMKELSEKIETIDIGDHGITDIYNEKLIDLGDEGDDVEGALMMAHGVPG